MIVGIKVFRKYINPEEIIYRTGNHIDIDTKDGIKITGTLSNIFNRGIGIEDHSLIGYKDILKIDNCQIYKINTISENVVYTLPE